MQLYYIGCSICFGIFSAGIWMLFFRDHKRYRRQIEYQKDIHRIKDTMKRTLAVRFQTKRNISNMEKEIYQGVAFLQNYVILQRYTPKGAIYTIEQLIAYMDKLKTPLERLLHYMRMNRGKEGVMAFANHVKSKYAEGFAKILVSLDDMSLTDVQETLEMYRQNIREQTITREKQKNEILSDLVYIPVMCNVMLIFINFIYIAYYAQQKELFQQLLF